MQSNEQKALMELARELREVSKAPGMSLTAIPFSPIASGIENVVRNFPSLSRRLYDKLKDLRET